MVTCEGFRVVSLLKAFGCAAVIVGAIQGLVYAIDPNFVTVGSPYFTHSGVPSGVTKGPTGIASPSVESISELGTSDDTGPVWDPSVDFEAGDIRSQITPNGSAFDYHTMTVKAKSAGKDFIWCLIDIEVPVNQGDVFSVWIGPGHIDGEIGWHGEIRLPRSASQGQAEWDFWYRLPFAAGGSIPSRIKYVSLPDHSEIGATVKTISESHYDDPSNRHLMGTVPSGGGDKEPVDMGEVEVPFDYADDTMTLTYYFGVEVENILNVSAEGGDGTLTFHTKTSDWFIREWVWPVEVVS